MYQQVMDDGKIQEKSDLLATHGFVRNVKIIKSNFIFNFIALKNKNMIIKCSKNY